MQAVEVQGASKIDAWTQPRRLHFASLAMAFLSSRREPPNFWHRFDDAPYAGRRHISLPTIGLACCSEKPENEADRQSLLEQRLSE